MTRRRDVLGCSALFLLVALCTACGAHGGYDPSAAGLALIVTELPAGSTAEHGHVPADPALRYPAGSRIVLVRPGTAPTDVLVLSGELHAAGGPALSPDGSSVLFAGRQDAQSTWAIYEVSLDESRPRPRRITESGTDCIDPAFLPGERFVSSCIAATHRQLHTAFLDGRERPDQVTFGVGEANYPSVLRDGRVLFTMSQEAGAGRPDPGMTALFTVNPDGTLPGAFAGSHTGPARKLRARQSAADDVLYIAAGRDERQWIESVPMGRPNAAPRVIALAWHDNRRSVSPPLDASSVEPLRDGGLLVTARRWGVFLADAGGETAVRLYDDPTRDEIEAIPVALRSEPRGRPVVVRPGSRTGTLVCYDSRRSDGVIGPGSSDPAASSMSIETRDGAQPMELRLEEDGSFLLEAPADVPLRVVSRDDDGRKIASSDWFWIRPGEVRACFGCHEGHERAPVNRVVQAIDGERKP